MNHISDMFGKLKSAFINQSDKKTAVILACAETTGVNLKPEQIEINNKTLRLMVSSSAKTTIFLKIINIFIFINLNIIKDMFKKYFLY